MMNRTNYLWLLTQRWDNIVNNEILVDILTNEWWKYRYYHIILFVFDLSHSLKIWKQILKAEATYVCFLQEIVYISKEQTIRIINYFI